MLRRDALSGRRRAAEIERRIRGLHRGKVQPALVDHEMAAAMADGFARHQPTPDRKKFVGDLVALIVLQPDPFRAQLNGIAAGHDVDEQAPLRNPVERRRHAGGLGRLLQTWPHRDQITELPRLGRQRRGQLPR